MLVHSKVNKKCKKNSKQKVPYQKEKKKMLKHIIRTENKRFMPFSTGYNCKILCCTVTPLHGGLGSP